MGLIGVIGLLVVIFVVDTVFEEQSGDGKSGQMWVITIAMFSLLGIIMYKGDGLIKTALLAVWLLAVIIVIAKARAHEKREQQFKADLYNAREAARRERELEEDEPYNPNVILCKYCHCFIPIGAWDEDIEETRNKFKSTVCPNCGKIIFRKDCPGIDYTEQDLDGFFIDYVGDPEDW